MSNLNTIYTFANASNWSMEKMKLADCNKIPKGKLPAYTLNANANSATIEVNGCWGLLASNSEQTLEGGVYEVTFDIVSNGTYQPFDRIPYFLFRANHNLATLNQKNQRYTVEVPSGSPSEVIFNFSSNGPATHTISNFVVKQSSSCPLPLKVMSDHTPNTSWLPSTKVTNGVVTLKDRGDSVTTPVVMNGYYALSGLSTGPLSFSLDSGWSSTVSTDSKGQYFVQIPMKKGGTLKVENGSSSTISFQIHTIDYIGCSPPGRCKSSTWTKPWMVFALGGLALVLLIIVIVLASRKPKLSITDNISPRETPSLPQSSP